MLGINNNQEKMFEMNWKYSFFFEIIFYFLVISILINMFWVFTKNYTVKVEKNE